LFFSKWPWLLLQKRDSTSRGHNRVTPSYTWRGKRIPFLSFDVKFLSCKRDTL
jgi:hypothetical protein